ncbi:hypothetical protein [Sphingomonas sp. Y38-1Y]|uniref:hypothetical protein n=1 Tax=Sphingomonas sp. Y38-1Y TaxID=3078265 RepID=UPI0028EDEA44|nr:hypothetical protein [Sphingomonas sp. Y38-1Y]
MRAGLVLAAAALVAGCTSTERAASDTRARGERELAAATKGRVAGPPQRCIDPQQSSGPQLIAPDALVYRDAGTTWVTRVEGCPFINRDQIVIAEVFGGQLCRNDRFRTVQRGGAAIPGPFCRYGNFTPYRRER